MSKRLPDFKQSKLFMTLREKMGADDSFELPSLDIGQISLSEIRQLKTSSINIENIYDHIDPIDGTFVYKGQKVLLYIKEQYYDMMRFDGTITYKYHLCYCNTLEQMESRGRFKKRYVVTQRTDGKFVVDIIDRITNNYKNENELFTMNVCKNCLSKLSNHYISENMFNYSVFDLEKFLEKYNTKHKKLPPHSPRTLPKNNYPDHWDVISRQTRERAGYICEKCKRDCTNTKNKLHVHHADGMKYNNTPSNLEVLCQDCHSLEPGHRKLKYLINN